MKKTHLALAVIMAAAASCTEQEAIETPENVNGMFEMTFSTFSDKFTKGTPDYSATAGKTGLAEHHKSFKVIATKFDGTTASYVYSTSAPGTVTYNDSTGKWTASPARYWDMNATDYYFYAGAPANPGDGWTYWIDTDSNSGTYMKFGALFVNGIQVTGENSVSTPCKSLGTAWTGTKDVDLMLSKDCRVTKSSTTFGAATPAPVNLEFFHLMTRLTIMVKKNSSITGTVKLNKLEIKNLKDKGDFDEGNRYSNTDILNNCARWKSSRADSAYTLTACKNENVSDTAYYVMESILIPQSAGYESVSLDGKLTETGNKLSKSDKPYMYVEYSIDGQKFYGYYNLSKLMQSETGLEFKEGWNYNLTINIAPKELSFSNNTYNWPSAEERSSTI